VLTHKLELHKLERIRFVHVMFYSD